MAEKTVSIPLTKADVAILDRACAVLGDVKRRAANAPRNSAVVRDAFNSEYRDVERVRAKINSLELPL